MLNKQKLLSFVEDQIALEYGEFSKDSLKLVEMKIRCGDFDIEYNIVDHLPSILKRIQDDTLELEKKVILCMDEYKKLKSSFEDDEDESTKRKSRKALRLIDIIEEYLNDKFNNEFDDFKEERYED